MPGTGDSRVVVAGRELAPAWDAYVRAHARGSVYHLLAWPEALAGALRHRPLPLALVAPDGRVRGVMPLVTRRGLVSGRRAEALPVARGVGPLADGPQGTAALLEAARERVRDRGIGSFVVRAEAGSVEASVPGLSEQDDLPAWGIDLPAAPAEMERQLRRRSKGLWHDVRRAGRAGVAVREAPPSASHLRTFQDLYARTMRGVPWLPLPRRLLTLVRDALGPGGMRLLVAERAGRPVGGAVLLPFGETVEVFLLGVDERARRAHVTHGLYWEMLCWAIDRGHRRLELGLAAPGSGLAAFKSRWTAQPRPRRRYAVSAGGDDPGIDPRVVLLGRAHAHRDGRAVGLWRRVPVPVTRAAGWVTWRYL